MCVNCELDGKPRVEYLAEVGTCLFGCGSVVDSDTGICHACGDHSANRAECEVCGAEYEDWGGTWKSSEDD